MDALVKTVMSELADTIPVSKLLEIVPRFVKAAEGLTIPGAERKAAVLKAMRELVQLLKEGGKIQEDLATEMNTFIDTSVATTIDLIIGVSKGQIELRMPRTVEEVAKQANCCLGFLQSIVGIVAAAKKVKKATAATATAEDAKATAAATAEDAKATADDAKATAA